MITKNLTYMSINEILLQCKGDRLIYELTPVSREAGRYRSLFLTKELRDELSKERFFDEDTERFVMLEIELLIFVTQPHIRPDYLRGLSPRGCGVWELKGKIDPQIRVFGMFLTKDKFVATHHAFRNDLGPFTSRKWKNAKRTCKTKFRNIFGSVQPILDTDIHNLVTGAHDEEYFKD